HSQCRSSGRPYSVTSAGSTWAVFAVRSSFGTSSPPPRSTGISFSVSCLFPGAFSTISKKSHHGPLSHSAALPSRRSMWTAVPAQREDHVHHLGGTARLRRQRVHELGGQAVLPAVEQRLHVRRDPVVGPQRLLREGVPGVDVHRRRAAGGGEGQPQDQLPALP